MLHCIYLAPQLYLQKRSFENTIIHSKSLEGGTGFEPPLILKEFFLNDHICDYVQVISIGGQLAPLKLIRLYSICIFIYIENRKSGLFIA